MINYDEYSFDLVGEDDHGTLKFGKGRELTSRELLDYQTIGYWDYYDTPVRDVFNRFIEMLHKSVELDCMTLEQYNIITKPPSEEGERGIIAIKGWLK